MKTEIKPQSGDLRVWWIPQIPMKPFIVKVGSIKEAKLILNTLADYNLFQLHNHIKPDYANAGGLEVYETDFDGSGKADWFEWENDYSENINDVDDTGRSLN